MMAQQCDLEVGTLSGPVVTCTSIPTMEQTALQLTVNRALCRNW